MTKRQDLRPGAALPLQVVGGDNAAVSVTSPTLTATTSSGQATQITAHSLPRARPLVDLYMPSRNKDFSH